MESLLGRLASNSLTQGILLPHPPELRKQQAYVSFTPPQDGDACRDCRDVAAFFFFLFVVLSRLCGQKNATILAVEPEWISFF